MDDLDETIATLLKHGPDLRRAGYQSVTIGEVSFTLHPPEIEYAPIAANAPKQTEEAQPSPLDDPRTYGWTEGRPGFKDPRPGKKASQ